MNLSLTGSQINSAKQNHVSSSRSNCSISSIDDVSSVKAGRKANSHQNLNELLSKVHNDTKPKIKSSGQQRSTKGSALKNKKDLCINATPLSSARSGTHLTKQHSVFLNSARSTSTAGESTARGPPPSSGPGGKKPGSSQTGQGSGSSGVNSASNVTGRKRGAALDMFLDLDKLDQDTDKLTQWFNTQEKEPKDWDEIPVHSTKATPRTSTASELCLQLNNSHASMADHRQQGRPAPHLSPGLDHGDARYDDIDLRDSFRTLTPPPIEHHQRPLPNTSKQFNGEAMRSSTAISLGRKVISPARRNSAAVTIQRWFRRHRKRQRAAQAAMRRLMNDKHQEWSGKLQQTTEELSVDGVAARKTKTLEEKRQLERQAAIEDMRRRREEKREADRILAENEVEKMREQGVIKEAAGNKKRKPLKSSPKESNKSSPVPSEAQRTSSPKDHPRQSKDVKNKSSPSHNPLRSTGNLNDFDDESDPPAPRSRQMDLILDDLSSTVTGGGAKTTLDDILSTIRELEADTPQELAGRDMLKAGQEGGQPRNAWVDDIDRMLNDDFRPLEPLSAPPPPASTPPTSTSSLTTDNLKHHQQRLKHQTSSKNAVRSSGAPQVSSGPQSGHGGGVGVSAAVDDLKLRSILDFLDSADLADRVSQLEAGGGGDTERGSATKDQMDNIRSEMERTTQMAVEEVKSTVLGQRLQLEERDRTVAMLQKALQQQRELTVRQTRETQRDMERRMETQRSELEATVQRNYSLIDQLIEEKKALQERCDAVVKDLKLTKQKTEDRIRNIEEKNAIELKKIDAKHAAAEKLRREKWEQDKTKLIKEMTVRGMEGEIASLIANHKAEVRRVKAQHESELMQADERAYQNYGKHVEDLRVQLTKEKEEACNREREMAKQRYESQLEAETQALEAQRRRLYSEVQDEKERLAALSTRQRAELDRMRSELEDRSSKSTEVLRKEFEQAREAQETRHQSELVELKDRLAAEKSTWEETYMKRQEAQLLAKERELKDQVKRERDKEIEMVIERLEEDSQSTRDQMERATDTKIKRMRDKYESEMAELERSERQAMEKYNQFKAKILEVEGDNERLKVLLNQKEKETHDIRQLYEKLNRERDMASDIIRQEFADRLVSTDEENKRVKMELSELRARLSQEQQKLAEQEKKFQGQKEQDMEEVHQKVKEAIKRKEENITELRTQYQKDIGDWRNKYNAAMQRAEHLEGLLEQQRKQLLQLKK